MTEVERYLFDLQGYLIVEDVLDAEAVAELNRLIDAQEMGADVEQAQGRLHTGGFLTWGQPFVDLLDHERIMPLLKVILGDGFRLDHYYAIYLEAGAERLGLHGGNTPYDPPEYYHFRNGQMYNGLTVVSWNLADTGPVARWFLLYSRQPQGQLSLSAGNPRGPCRGRVRSGAGGESWVGGDFYRGTHARYGAVAGRAPAALAVVQIQSRTAVVVQTPHCAAGRGRLDRAASSAF